MWIRALLTILLGYLLGNLNGAFLMSKLLTHEDIRNSGSGNAGLTNFMRKFGPSSGIWVLLIDFVKALLACLLGRFLLAPVGYALEGQMLGALAVSLGHDFPALMGFRGGKGIVCGLAIAVAADWRCALILLAVFGLCLALTRYVSLSSILASAAFSISFGIMYHDRPFAAVVGVIIGLLAIFMHRANIGRLLKGTEKKATFSKFKKKKS